MSNDDGSWHLNNLAPGRYVVWLFRGALGEEKLWTQDWAVEKREVAVVADATQQADFQFVKGAIIRGRVVARGTGEPVAGQYVGLFDSQESYRYAVTRADGTFSFRVIGGLQHLWLHRNQLSPPPGYQIPARDNFDFEVADGQTYALTLKLAHENKPLHTRTHRPAPGPLYHAISLPTHSLR